MTDLHSVPWDASVDPEIALLLDLLPERVRDALRRHPLDTLVEIVLDLGRPPEARLAGGAVTLDPEPITRADLAEIVGRVGTFGDDNRAGIERTLHRISAIRNRRGEVVGLTLRVGRAVVGTIDMLRDLVESGRNLLLLGRPGIGKTTKLREVARVLADDLGKRVLVIDTSNEIAGDGDVPHPGIGRARRMQVPRPDAQHGVMIEAVENHMPEAIIVDEIGTRHEAEAARTIAERGVQLVGTAHGNTLENLLQNPTLSDLVGGIETVTLSDEEARRRGTPKTITERRAPPTFDIVVELVTRDEVIVHRDTAAAVDRLLAGRRSGAERRVLHEGHVRVVDAPPVPPPPPRVSAVLPGERADREPRRGGPPRIYAPGIPRDVVRRVAEDMGAQIRPADRAEAADLVLLLKSRAGLSRLRRVAEDRGIPVYTVKRVSTSAIRKALRHALHIAGGYDEDEVRAAVADAERAITLAVEEGRAVPLAPRPSRLRAVQHEVASRCGVRSYSVGSEPDRHLVVAPPGGEE